ncbi:unnamed protein product [Prunus brigantina]
MIGRADIEGSKSNVAMNAWLPQAAYPLGFPLSVPPRGGCSTPGESPRRNAPGPSPGRHAATRSRRGSSSSSPPTADGFRTGTPVPSPSQPILFPRLRIHFADFPCLHCSIDRRLFTLETRCGYEYDRA